MKKRYRASWMATRSQPWRRCIGVTKSVQEYWKLATATMPRMPAASCTQRLDSSGVFGATRVTWAALAGSGGVAVMAVLGGWLIGPWQVVGTASPSGGNSII